jgi:hypothetical protein
MQAINVPDALHRLAIYAQRFLPSAVVSNKAKPIPDAIDDVYSQLSSGDSPKRKNTVARTGELTVRASKQHTARGDAHGGLANRRANPTQS